MYYIKVKVLDENFCFQAIRELQNSARDTIFLLKALLSEIQQSSEDEKKAITDLYNLMMEKITEMKTDLLKEVDRYKFTSRIYTNNICHTSAYKYMLFFLLLNDFMLNSSKEINTRVFYE